jgi:hypothetical protein
VSNMTSVMLSSFTTLDSTSALEDFCCTLILLSEITFGFVSESTFGLAEGACVACEERSAPTSDDCKAINTDWFADVPPVVLGVDVGL